MNVSCHTHHPPTYAQTHTHTHKLFLHKQNVFLPNEIQIKYFIGFYNALLNSKDTSQYKNSKTVFRQLSLSAMEYVSKSMSLYLQKINVMIFGKPFTPSKNTRKARFSCFSPCAVYLTVCLKQLVGVCTPLLNLRSQIWHEV